jgi:chorismate synthase
MPKTFYTERDILELVKRGVTALDVNDDVVLTDLAVEQALRAGIRLVRTSGDSVGAEAALAHRVKAAVIARLGDQVDAKLLEAVVTRVVSQAK